MSELDQVNAFIVEANRASDAGALRDLLSSITGDMGFSYFSLFGHEGRPGDADRGHFYFTNYPESWIDRVRTFKYYVDDPVYAASCRTSVGFRVSELDRLVKLNNRQKRTLSESRRAGLGDGFSIPSHIPGEAHGLCTFLMAEGRDPLAERLPVAQLIGAFAYDAARRLGRRRLDLVPAAPTRLTDRQLDCVLLIARGKTDWEIAQILGLKEDTVSEYIDDARDRYGVARRTQLVVRALYDGHITLRDALN